MSARPTLTKAISSSMRTPTTPRSILKRAAPPPLPLESSPAPSFNITIIRSPSSASQRAITPRSAHVHFPPSASLTATFAVHSPNSYDRGAIQVSPNPLEIPSWGDRVWSPSLAEFKTPSSPGPGYKTFGDTLHSPGIKTLRASPLSSPIVANMGETQLQVPPRAKTQAGKKFRERVASAMMQASEAKDLGKSLMQYPRSPYPTATTYAEREKEKECVVVAAELGDNLGVQRTTSVYGEAPIRVSKRVRPPPFLPSPGSSQKDLNEAFWKSISLEDDLEPRTAQPIIFGRENGEIWEEEEALEGMFSARPKAPDRSSVMSPTPADPFSAFPSFSAAISLDTGIQKPDPVALD